MMALRRVARSLVLINAGAVGLIIVSHPRIAGPIVSLVSRIATPWISGGIDQFLTYIYGQSQGIVLFLVVAIFMELVRADYQISLNETHFTLMREWLNNVATDKAIRRIILEENFLPKGLDHLDKTIFSPADVYDNTRCLLSVTRSAGGYKFEVSSEFSIKCRQFYVGIASTTEAFHRLASNERIHEYILKEDANEHDACVKSLGAGEVLTRTEKIGIKSVDRPVSILPIGVRATIDLLDDGNDDGITILGAKFPPEDTPLILKYSSPPVVFSETKRFVFWNVDRSLYLKDLMVVLSGFPDEDLQRARVISPLNRLLSRSKINYTGGRLPIQVEQWMLPGQNIIIAWD